jgi:hypothetical protein
MKTIQIIALILGTLFVFTNIIIRFIANKKDKLIQPEDENIILIGFLLMYTGLWLVIISGINILHDIGILPFRFNVIVGAFTGAILGLYSLYFWMLSDDKYEKKPALGEPIGGAFIGCFGLIFSIVAGIILGLIFH